MWSPLKSIITLLCLGAFQVGCAQFLGPGGYVTGDDYGSPRKVPTSEGQYLGEDFVLRWPVTHVQQSQGFRPPKNPTHQGLDLRGPRHTPIFAAHNGTVIYAGSQFRGYGRMIILEFNHEWATLYGHLQKIMVKEGQKIMIGDQIGTMGRSGRASGVHLHFEVLKNKVPIDPMLLLSNDHHVANQ